MGRQRVGKEHTVAPGRRPDRARRGRVFVDGEDLAGMSDRRLTIFRRRRIGVMFQAFNLIPVDGRAERPVAGAPMARGHARERSREFARLRPKERRTHRPDALSGGEQQRVAFARALIADPAIVLADEPTGSLDSVTGQELCRLLQELCREQNRTIVVVTHEPAVATWTDRVIVLADGRVLADFRTEKFSDAQSLAAHYHDTVRAASPLEASS